MKQAKKAKGLLTLITQFSHLILCFGQSPEVVLVFKSPLFYKGYFTGFRANFTIGGTE
jgi:hypothetical protein